MKIASKKRKEISSATILQTLGLILACSGLLALTAFAADPAWWNSRGAVSQPVVTTNDGVVTTNYVPNDYAAVTQGQLKQFTRKAVDELNANLSGGAGTNLNSMMAGWSNDYYTNGYNATNIKPSDYDAMTVGQVKYVGNKVWAQLVSAGYTSGAPSWLALNTNTDGQVANLGQLKELFNFDLSSSLSAPVISSATTASGTVGVTFSYTITASNSPTSYSVTGSLPGLAVNTSTGVISGIPTGAGTYTLTLGATNSSGTGTATLTLTINPAAPVITSGTTASGTTGEPFSYSITANNTPTSFSATGLPSGLSVNTSTGVISGTPTASGTSTITLGAANAGGSATSVTLTLTVSDPPVPVITSGTTATGDVGVAFSYSITATNAPTSFSASGLPTGLGINTSTGTISGTPTSTGTSTVTLGAANAGGSATSVTLTLTVNGATAPVITSGLATAGLYGVAFSYTITASNSPTSYNATGLPAGLSVDTGTGVISGTPTSSSTATVSASISATNSSGTGSATLIFSMNPPAPVISSDTTSSGYLGVGFSYTITASNNPTSYSASGLPAGLSVDATTGVISGTPTAVGSSTVTLDATNAGGTGTTSLSLTISIPFPTPVIDSPTIATGVIGTSFTYTITTATLGTVSSFSASGLPAGLSIDTGTGVISGTPTTAGTSSVTLGASNPLGTGTQVLVLTINPAGAPVISSVLTASGIVGSSETYTITASNSPTSYNASGLPPGLSINTSTGTITGTPSAVGVSVIIIGASNSIGTGAATLTLTINPPVPVIGSATTASGTFGQAITSYAITASNNPTSFGATGLPPGLYVDPTLGIITGTPTAAGTFSTTISATNAGGTGTATLTFTIGTWSSSPIATRSVAAGDYQTLVLRNDGTVWGKGYNFHGELGNGGDATSDYYTEVSGLTGVVAIASEAYTSLALKSDGTVWAWGNNYAGSLGNGTLFTSSLTPEQVSTSSGPLTGIIAIAGGEYFALALKSDGTVWAWGWDNVGQLGNGDNTFASSGVAVQVSGLTSITAIACGGYHGLAVKSDGTAWCWGANEAGELGNGSTTASNVPVEVSGVTGVTAVSGGGGIDSNGFSAALQGDGTVWTWGDGNRGRLGNGTTGGNTTVPVQVSNLNGATSICASRGDHVLALTSEGTVWAWGQNAYYGQLGNGSTLDSNVPVQVSNLTGVVALAAGAFYSTVVEGDGTIWSWGSNADGEIGPVSPATQLTLPTIVTGLSGITAIAAAKSHYLAVKSDGTVLTWDDTTPGLSSDGVSIVGSVSPIPVPGLTGITAVACGTFFNMALKSDGTVWTWGLNNFGQLGNGTNTDNQVPEQVGGLSGITAIAAGGYFAMALKSDGTVWTWGENNAGELGDGTYTNTNTPAQISSGSLSGITAISAGPYHAMALKSDTTVWMWGENNAGELGGGTLAVSNVPVEIPSFSGVTAICTEYFHSIALKSDGTLWTWGLNIDGELGLGTGTNTDSPYEVSSLSGISNLSQGSDSFHTLAVKSDGTLWSFGSNQSGQLGVGVLGSTGSSPSPTGSLIPVQVIGLAGATISSLTCGEYSTVALKSDGTVLQWGDISYQPFAFSVPIQTTNLNATPAPVITPAPGSYSSSQTISISSTVTGTIHYTLDGTEPTADSPIYTTSFTLGQSALVTAGVFDGTGTLITPLASNQFYVDDSSNSGLPVTPTGLSVSVVSSSEIDLGWTLSGLANYSMIDIYRSSDGGVTFQLIDVVDSSATSYVDTSVQVGTNYEYYVGTVNTSGESDTSASSSVTPTSATITLTVTTPSGATPLP